MGMSIANSSKIKDLFEKSRRDKVLFFLPNGSQFP
jgi:hypothetical protein